MLAALVIAVAAAIVVVELRAGEPFGHGRHGDEWAVRFEDDFEGDALDGDAWNTCHWWDDGGCTISSNDELEWYLPSQVSVSDGRLWLTAEEAEVEGSDGERYPYRSGMVTTGPPAYGEPARFDFTYGRVEARVRAPEGAGLWAAVWMLPSSTSSRPEIDILEVLGNDPTERIFHLHPADRGQDPIGHRIRGRSMSEGWHDVGLEWEPELLRWFVDGDEVWRVEGDQVPDEPMYLVANLAVGGEYPGPPDGATRFPATFEIDRVTVWQRRT